MPLLLLLLGSSLCYGQAEEYRYKRKIEGVSQDWHSIPLPNSLFGKMAASLTDLRIWGLSPEGDTLEMPYLLKGGPEKNKFQPVPFHLINQTKNAQGYFYTLEVPQELPLNEIKLQFGNPNFDWQVVLEGSHNQKQWFTILEDYRIVSIENEFTDYSFTTLRFPAIRYKYLRLQIKSKEKPELMPVTLFKKEEREREYQSFPIQSFEATENKKDKQTLVDISLPQTVPVSYLSLKVKDTIDYYRPISIMYVTDSTQTQEGWRYHYRTIYRGTLSSLEEPVFTFPAAITSHLRVQIDHGHNLPLSLEGAEAKGYSYSLTTRLGGAQDYYLVYGNSQAYAASYDIALFKNNIPDQLPELQLGPEELVNPQNLTATSPLFSNKLWLWVIMLVLIGIMAWFTLKMLRTAQQNQEA